MFNSLQYHIIITVEQFIVLLNSKLISTAALVKDKLVLFIHRHSWRKILNLYLYKKLLLKIDLISVTPCFVLKAQTPPPRPVFKIR